MSYFFGIIAGIGFFGIVIFIGLYVMMSLGLYTMAQKRGIENPWLAWIPYANFYILGKVIRTLKIGTYNIPSIEYVLPAGALLTLIAGGFVGSLLSLAFFILFLFALNKLYKIYTPNNATLYTVLSILGFLVPIFIFIIRDNEPLALE